MLTEVHDLAPIYRLPIDGPTTDDRPLPVPALLQAVSTDENGYPVAKEVAARLLVQVLREARSITTPRGTLDALGVVVDANIVLEGLDDRQLHVSWSIWSTAGTKRLFGAWLREVGVYGVRAERDRDTASFDFWVPLPKGHSIQIRLLLKDGSTVLASKRSPAFG